MRALVLVAAVAMLGCSDPANTQYLPIGSRCTMDIQCGTPSYGCLTAGYPGGYCSHACTTDGDCPMDAVCVARQCMRRCSQTSDCRFSEGYGCHLASGATASVCAPGPAPMDLGPPAPGPMDLAPRPPMDLGPPSG